MRLQIKCVFGVRKRSGLSHMAGGRTVAPDPVAAATGTLAMTKCKDIAEVRGHHEIVMLKPTMQRGTDSCLELFRELVFASVR